MSRKRRQRKFVRFWLDVNREDDLEGFDFIQVLKRERAFTRTMRDMLTLAAAFYSHDAKRVMDVLHVIAPWFTTWIEEQWRSEVTRRTAGEGDLREEIAYLKGKVETLEQQRYLPPNDLPVMQPALKGGPKPLAVPAITAGFEDDDEDIALTIRKDKSSGANAVQNFLNAASALQGIVAD